MNDHELVNAFLCKKAGAFEALAKRWKQSIYNFAFRYVRDRQLAAEVCQTTLVRLYEKGHSIRDPEQFSAWLFQIVLNLCRDELKRLKRRRAKLVDMDDMSMNSLERLPLVDVDSNGHPESQMITNNYNDLLNRALSTLNEEQRAVIILKSYQGLKFREIAEILKISENTAKSRMYYGLSALKKTFDKWNISKERLGI